MKPDPRITLNIGINETELVFRSRLRLHYDGYISDQDVYNEAFLQSVMRDIEMARTVNELKLPLYRLLEKL